MLENIHLILDAQFNGMLDSTLGRLATWWVGELASQMEPVLYFIISLF